MNGSSGSKPLSPVLALILLMTATGGIWYMDRPIVTWRPPAPAGAEPQVPSELFARTRLWEDPLAAVRRREFPAKTGASEQANAPPVAPSLGTIEEEFRAALGDPAAPGGELRLLPVIVPGSNKDSDIETRLRTRYAVLAALYRQEFVGDEWDKLRYLKIRTSELRKPVETCGKSTARPAVGKARAGASSESAAPLLLVPYEWFTSLRRPRTKVLVLWLDDNEFGESVLGRASRLVELVAGLSAPGARSASGFRLTVHLVGPTWSSTLVEMLKELAEPSFCKPASMELAVYSPWATIGHERLMAEVRADARSLCWQELDGTTRFWRRAEGRPCETGPGGDIVIERTITDDARLVRELIFELKDRGVRFCDDQPVSIALISEWDSLYGQVFEETFRGELTSKRGNPCDGKTPQVRLLRFVYLMGLDGSLPGDPVDAPSGANSTRKNRDAAAEDIERPDGRSQVDYLRRLANRLVEEHSDTLKAVGVLGSDVFDKLLVLEAIRDRLPQAVFFTTDLDARFLHPSQRRWTRNLVVASSFGLDYPERSRLKAPEDGGLPPFRDNYQTAMYAACLRALAFGPAAEAKEPSPLKDELERPKIYEIGRTQIFRLDRNPPERRNFDVTTAHRIAIAFLLVVLLAGTILVSRRRKLRSSDGRELPWWLKWHWCAVLSLTLVLVSVEVILYRAQGIREPFAWLEGVSVWPSAILRTATSILAAAFLAWLPGRVRLSDGELCRLFRLPDRGTAPRGWKSWLPVVRCTTAPPADGKPLADLWAAYMAGSAPRRRVRRIAALSAIYLFLSVLTFNYFGLPHTPYRGSASLAAASVPLGVCVLLQVLLTFFVVDATCLCLSLVRQVARGRNQWPQHAAERWQVPESAADEALAVDLIARQTKVVGQMILYPFAVILLVIISRNLYFDQWDWPVTLLLVYGVNTLIAFSCALLLWWSGEAARRWALHGLQERLLREEAAKEGSRAPQLRLLIETVRSIREGAFAPLTQHPLFVALFMPFGGLGMASLLDLLAKSL